MAFDINVLGTGSSGNSILIDDTILIDIGLGYRTIKDALHAAQAIFVTHRHGDHLNMSALNGLIKNRPVIVSHAMYMNADTKRHAELKVSPKNAPIVSKVKVMHGDGWTTTVKSKTGHTYTVETYPLDHDVENQGFVITNEFGEKLIHATDTTTMKYAPQGIYDYLLIEGNWDEDKFDDIFDSGDYNLMTRALYNMRHLSVQDMEAFVRAHSHENSMILQLHESMELGSKSLMNTSFTHSDLTNHLASSKSTDKSK